MADIRDRGSVLATEHGIEILQAAKACKRDHNDKPWTYENIKSQSGIDVKTIGRFFRREKRIDESSARSICLALEVEFNDVVETRSNTDNFSKQKQKIDWQTICRGLLNQSTNLTTNALTASNGIRFKLDEIFVPLGVVERQQKTRHHSDDGSPERGSKLYEEKVTPISQNDFFEQVLLQGQSKKSQGRRLAIIGEPGAGKTTQLQKIGEWILQKTDGIPIWIPLAAISKKPLRDYLLDNWLQTVTDELEVSQQYREDLGQLLKTEKVWLLLDGADEMSVTEALQQIAIQMSEGWLQNVRVVLTCRLNVWDAGKNALDQFFDVYRNLDFDYPVKVHQFIDKWFTTSSELQQNLKSALDQPGKERIRDMVKNPLRLTLLCYSWQSRQGELPKTKAGLYEWFVDTFHEWNKSKVPVKLSAIKRKELNLALGEIAKEAINQESSCFRLQKKLVNQFLGDVDDEDSLSYLALQLGWLNRVGVAEENPLEDVYAFFHPTFQEYFVALSLKKNPSIIGDLLRDQFQPKKWFYPLTMAISQSDHKTVARLLTPVVEKYPNFAIELIREETTEFGDEELPLPEPQECGQQIQEAMQAWVIGLEPLSKLIAPLRADGRVCSIGIASHGARLNWAWYIGTEEKEAVTDLPTKSSFIHFDTDWIDGGCLRGNEPAWAWRWTLGELISRLWRRVDVSRFAVENADLTHEAAWNAALAILRLLRRIDNFWQLKQIPISTIEPKLKEIEGSNIIYCGIWGSTNPSDLEKDYYFRQLRTKINHLQNLGETVLNYPWPGPDLNTYGQIANSYSMEQLKTRMEKVYKAALDAYQLLTQTWFKPILPGFNIAVQLPARLIGIIYPKDVYYAEQFDSTIMEDYNPEFRWFLQPLLKGQANDVWIKIATQYPEDEFNQRFERAEVLTELRPEAYLSVKQKYTGEWHLQDELFSSTPATAIIFRWLKDDLKESGWWAWNSLLADRDMFSRW